MAKSKSPPKKDLNTHSRDLNSTPNEIDPLIEFLILKLLKISSIICLIILLLILGGKLIMHLGY